MKLIHKLIPTGADAFERFRLLEDIIITETHPTLEHDMQLIPAVIISSI